MTRLNDLSDAVSHLSNSITTRRLRENKHRKMNLINNLQSKKKTVLVSLCRPAGLHNGIHGKLPQCLSCSIRQQSSETVAVL